MSNLRRWARVYYNLSPIFQDSLFQKAGNEGLAAINPRLFAAYCIKMAKQNIYTKEKINELVKHYFSMPNYWTTYTLQLLQTQQKAISNIDQDLDSTRMTFQTLISKFYYQTITKKEFKLMCECIKTLQVKKKVTQLDYYVLDISYGSIDQVVEIAEIGEETAIEAIGNNALKLIQNSTKHEINPYPFQLINLFNQLKDTASLSLQLTNLHSMLQGSKKIADLFNNTRKQSGICMRKQTIGYMLWLLNVNELGEFVSKFVRQDYLFIRYCQSSVQLTCNILQAIEVTSSMSLSQLLLLNETVHKLQDMQQQKNFFEHVKRNVLIQIKLKGLKEKIIEQLNRLGQANFQNHEWIREVDKIEIDFKSSLSINIVKKAISKLMENQHFSLILPEDYYPMLLRLCIKINELDLYKKLKSKIEKRRSVSNDRKAGLLLYLENFYDNEVMNKYANFQIYSIYQLKRIKNFYLKYGDKVDKMIHQMNNNDVELLKSFFAKLKKGSKDISQHDIDHTFAKLFQHFKL